MSNTSFGIGAYSPSEAARLTGLPSSAIRRWLFGYSYNHQGLPTTQAPLWRPEYGLDQDDPVLGFRDLIEARMVGNLRNLGIGLPTIRRCMNTAAEIANDDHPFSSANFRTDGTRLFLERLGEDGKHDVIDLKTRQHAFAKIVERSFLDLEFDDCKATRWFLLPKKQTIVADPKRSFGQPITTDSGIPTARLAQAVTAEGSVEKVAKLFEIAVGAVRDALRFETLLAKPQTA
ncbi:hypothetical protein EWE75_19725 [Sphingomonas populi]|uniref:Putative antitoxin VapB45-like DNA-binding HTH domain-containing protein n=1 Tax=Sphingomonas populi TaxID=2484750 RepID=A0A4Q6XWE1_9SPHN|nr:helix-turn-helix domain-containing protein [Sphingomonas populi]RZF61067.1 hypothetical protein EWE75_19725 [Sphingomonas populi]